MLCPVCARTTGAIYSIRSPFRFDSIARKAIHQLKYHNLRALAPTLAAYMVASLNETGYEPDMIVPVPLHAARLRQRGYNQSLLLAREIEKRTKIPVCSDALTRIKEGTSQVRTPNMEERKRNVSDAFACNSPLISGKRILVVDDVCTTGATLESCAQSLRRAGAIEVQGLTVAKEI
ncbi:MAG: ComF family protein [Dehalococcoidia bacterium]|nr:ComF family protein [Dehalococcoidia bacterium]